MTLPARAFVTILAPVALACATPGLAQREVQVLHGHDAGGAPQQGFAHALALDGDTAVVGWLIDPTTPANGTGSAYFFERGPQGWARVARFYANPPGHTGLYGTPAVSGDRAAVTTWAKSKKTGQVHFYERVGGAWQFDEKTKPADLEWDDEWGFSVAMEGDTLIVGAPKDDEKCPADPQCNSGSAYVYGRGPQGWEERAKLLPSDPGRFRAFGVSVAIDGDRVAVGAYSQDESRGAVYVFEENAGAWSQTAKLQAHDAEPGEDFGTDVDLDGERLLVGCNGDGENGVSAGAAYVFEHDAGSWTRTAKLIPAGTDAESWAGWVVAHEGSVAMVGAPNVLWKSGHGTLAVFDFPEAVTPYCFGISCPCANDDGSRGCANSTTRGGLLAASGSASVATDDLVLEATTLPPARTALLVMGGAAAHLPRGDGHLCVAAGSAGVFHFPPTASDAEGAALWTGLVATSAALFPPRATSPRATRGTCKRATATRPRSAAPAGTRRTRWR